MEAWKQGWQAIRTAEAERRQTTEATVRTPAQQAAANIVAQVRAPAQRAAESIQWATTGRHGWTMAAALIWYKQREQQGNRGPGAATGTHTTQEDKEGRGVVVFDVETTHLIDDDTEIEDMEVSVATATWLPEAASAAACSEVWREA